jgi:purine-binding chemotaxis protein CheW
MAISGLSEPLGQSSSYFTFFLGDEEYGAPLGRVVEIAPEEDLTRVPGTPELLQGVVEVRGRPVAVVDLARKFGLPSRARSKRRSLVIVQTEAAGEDSLMAVVADRIGGVSDILAEAIEPVPPLSSGIRAEFLLGMVRRERSFVLLLDLHHVLSATEREALTGLLDAERSEPEVKASGPELAPTGSVSTPAVGERARRFVIVEAAGLRCAIDASWVREVTVAGAVTSVPGAPRSFLGLMNLRGAVLPILDLAAAMGPSRFTPRARSAFLVLDPVGSSEQGMAGLAVEAVLGMAEVSLDEIEAVPAFASPAPPGLLEGTSLAGGKPMLIVDLPALLSLGAHSA